MITHATYHAERPLTSGPTLSQLLRGVIAPPSGRLVVCMPDAYAKAARPDYEHIDMLQKRVNIYRPAMIGRGWMTPVQISDKSGVNSDSVRGRMVSLNATGHVERRVTVIDGKKLLQYRWSGK